MAKKPPIRVALDLETTGLHAEQDAILEIAAIKFQGNTILDQFETLVAPGRSIPYRVQRLTGITPQQLNGAPQFESISRRLQHFLGDYALVGHSIPFDVSFLRRRGLARSNPLIDTFELATVLLPSLPSYNLGQVAHALNVSVSPERHRAMVDTVLAMQVFLALHERLQTVDLLLLKDLASLDAPRSWPLLAFFRQELYARQEQDGLRGTPLRGSLGDQFAAQLGMDPRILSFAIARETPSESGLTPLLDGQTSSSLQALERVQTLVEVAPEQDEQSAARSSRGGYTTAYAAVRDALEQHKSMLLEVTVGGDDYTPALLPALEWLAEASTTNDTTQPARRLVIACSSQQGARRLIEITLPRLQTSLKSKVSVAYLAEPNGYLCVHRWFGAALRRTSGELTAEQARGLAKLGLWAQQTLTGEQNELTMLPQELSAWERISSGVEHVPLADGRSDTAYERCVYRRKGYCFVSKAEARVNSATIVVTTHTGLFRDLARPHSLLSSIEHRLVLDADLLEEEHTRWGSAELDKTRLVEMLNTIGTELPDGRYQGLLALAAPALRENGPGGLSTTPTVSKAELDSRMLAWFHTLHQACQAIDYFFNTLYHLIEEAQQQTSNADGGGRDRGRGDPAMNQGPTGRFYRSRNNSQIYRGSERTDQPLRLTESLRNLGSWMDVERAWQQATQRLQAVIDMVHEAEKIILTTLRNRRRLDFGTGEQDSVALELAAAAQRLLGQKQLGQQAITLEESEMVYWLRMPPPSPPPVQQMAQQRTVDLTSQSGLASESVPVLHAQIVQSAAFLKRNLLKPGESTIFAGTSLSVEGGFSFYRSRFGLDHSTYPALSVIREHQEQTLIYLPNDVPEPNTPQYQRHLDEALVQLASVLEGQLVVLFTSHAALRTTYSAVKPLLEAQGILVLGHGIDGSPRQLWNTYRDQEHVVLLGTGNFWDSEDEVTRVPACVVVTRLPMPVLHDPPMAARAEHQSDQLHQVTVPVAALRLRRTLNRLAWSTSTRNVIVLFDRRVISKDYGSTILHTLPQCSQRQSGVSHMPETVLDWLTTTGSWIEKE
jgi:ATP-dependent DNA helicase DinG